MADNNTKTKTPTHTAYAFRREGKKHGRWLEIGTARAESAGLIRVFLDRLPIGGFTGGVMLSPIGQTPVLPEPEPTRPGDSDED
jgi:hypothetical protein